MATETQAAAPPGATTEPAPTASEEAPEPAVRTEVRAPGGYRAVLAVPAFRLLWLAHLGAGFGEALASIALPLLAYAVTGSPALASIIFVAQIAPRIVLAPLAGLLADRLDRRRLMLGADLGRAVLVCFLPFADRAWQIALLATLVAVGSALARPAELAAVPMVVTPGQLVQALSATQVAGSFIRIVGPGVGAVLIGAAGIGAAFVAQAACFLVSFALLLRLRLPVVARPPRGDPAAAIRREISDGLRQVWINPIVRGITAVEMLWQTVVACFVVVLVALTEETLALGERAGTVYALLMAAFSLGTTVGALLAGRVERRIGRPWLMAIGYLAPLMLLPAGLWPELPVLFACWTVLGFTDAWAVIAMQAYLAEAVPDELRGRVYAFWMAVVSAGAALAFPLAGLATVRLGAPATLAAAGLLVGVGGPLLLLATGAIAAMRRQARPAA
jgi:NRE family putative nickel resistance protein-like MFS transporter